MGLTPADGPPAPDGCPSTSRFARPSADVRVNNLQRSAMQPGRDGVVRRPGLGSCWRSGAFKLSTMSSPVQRPDGKVHRCLGVRGGPGNWSLCLGCSRDRRGRSLRCWRDGESCYHWSAAAEKAIGFPDPARDAELLSRAQRTASGGGRAAHGRAARFGQTRRPGCAPTDLCALPGDRRSRSALTPQLGAPLRACRRW